MVERQRGGCGSGGGSLVAAQWRQRGGGGSLAVGAWRWRWQRGGAAAIWWQWRWQLGGNDSSGRMVAVEAARRRCRQWQRDGDGGAAMALARRQRR